VVEPSHADQIRALRAFGETADPRGHVPRRATDALLAALLDWCQGHGRGSTVATLVAPPGYGKTHLLRVLEVRLAARRDETRGAGVRALYLPYAALSLRDLCDWVHGLLGDRRSGTLGQAEGDSEGEALAALLALARRVGSPLHLLIDDAEAMPVATLRSLVEGLPVRESPLRLVLALPDDSRATRMLANLDPLVPFETRLHTPLDASETEAYLRARLAREALGPELLDGLDSATVSRIFGLSGGVPRHIHRVVGALLEPERAALARALAIHPRTDAWLGGPLDDAP
jgi:type II secretory pathway predicted ATPase ExeA